MARDLHTVEKGLRITSENGNEQVDRIFAAGAPVGTSGATDDADIGSIYTNTTNGAAYIKTADTSSASDWVKLADSTEVGTGTRGQSLGVTTLSDIDTVLVDDIKASEWEVHVAFQDNPDRIRVFKIFASHDGTASADATEAKDTTYAKLKFGANFNIVMVVDVNGTGGTQTMRLRASSTETNGVDITWRRNDIKDP